MENYADGGEAIVEALRNLDVDYVMSSPGSEWGAVWEAFTRQQVSNRPGPKYLSCWHETLAVNLATGYTAATGRMQAVILHAGAGLLQGSMGVHGALISETPMIVMSGESLTYGEQDGFDPGRQWLTSLSIAGGTHRLVEPIVKWSDRATSSSTLYAAQMRAGEMAQRTPDGPTYLSVPVEVMLEEWNRPAKNRQAPVTPKQLSPSQDVDKVAELLVNSDYPVISTGAAGYEPEGFNGLLALAETLAIPVVESDTPSFANFPKDNPLHQGFSIQPHLMEADLVLVVRNKAPWYPPGNCPEKAKIVILDENPFKTHMVYQNLQADIYLEGDVVASLESLVKAVQELGFDQEKVDRRRKHWSAEFSKSKKECEILEEKAKSSDPMGPSWLCSVLADTMPANTAYVDETTTNRLDILRHLNWNTPRSYFRTPSGLGQGLGVALGVKLAMQDRPVVSLIGDGGFLYNPVTQALGLSMEANLPIMIVVFNNRGYRAMRNNHLSYYPDGVGKQNEIYLGHPIDGPDYSELVKPFGGFGRHVTQASELQSALQDGLTATKEGKTAVINVEISD